MLKAIVCILLWLALFAISWPLAIGALLLVPVVWVVSLPIRLLIWVVEALLALVKTILFLPARLLGYRN